jgi:hypothetical protein
VESKASTNRIDGLEIEEDYNFQKRSWMLQRWGRLGIQLFILAGLLGFFGGGGFGMRKLTDAGKRVHLEHSRFARFGATYDLKIEAGPTLVENDRLVVRLDAALLEMLEVENVTPEPESQELQGERVTYRFRVQAISQPATLAFRLKPIRRGFGGGRVAVGASGDIRVAHFVFP